MDKTSKKDFIIRICCFIAAFCLWIFVSNESNPIKTVTVKNVKIELINSESILQNKLIVQANQELSINLVVKGLSNKVFDLKSDNFELVADLGAYALRKGSNMVPVEIKDSPSDVTIVKDDKFWVDIEIDEYKETNFNIKTDKINIKQKDGLFINEPIIKPLEAKVSGPSMYMSKVEGISAIGDINDFKTASENDLRLIAVDKKGNEIKEVNINPKYARVTVSSSKIKTVPIKINTVGTLPKAYIIEDSYPSPGNIQITGGDSELEKITSISTEPINIENLSGTNTVDVKLIVPPKISIINSEQKITAVINILKLVQKDFSIKIKTINISSEYEVVLQNEDLSVTLSASETKTNSLVNNDINCFVDLTGLKPGEYTLPINIVVPTGITVNSKSSDKVSVIIKKK